MFVWSHLSTIFDMRRVFLKIGFGIGLIVFITMFILIPDTSAAPTSQTINFSARLKSSSGAIVPDGNYNLGFRMYSQASGGSPVWSETYYDTNGPATGGDNRVRISAGYMTVKLGSLEALDGIDWNSDLWITLNVGGTSQIGSTAEIPWDGEMSPRIKLSAVPYAMNAAMLDGRSADQFLQVGGDAQADASSGSTISINKTGEGNILNFQANGSDVFNLDKSGSITLGGTTEQSIMVAPAASGDGGQLLIAAGSASSGSGGDLVLQAGSSNGLASGGNIQIDAGGGQSGGSIVLGGANATSVDIGNDDSSTTIKGSLAASSMTLGNNDAETAGELTFTSGSGFTGSITGSSLTANRTYSLPDSSGTFCLQGSEDCGFIKTDPLAAQTGNLWLTGGGSFGGNLTIRTSTNSSSAFRVLDSDGMLVLGVDTQNNRINIGSSDTTATLLVLGTRTDEGDPDGFNGAMYYSEDRGKMRCYENGFWDNCLSNTKGAPTNQTTHYTADYGDFVLADSSAGAFNVTLPEPRAGAVVSVKKINAGNTINVTCQTATIDNLSAVSLSSQWVSQDFYSDGERWYRV